MSSTRNLTSTLFLPDALCAAAFVLACELLLFSWPVLPAQDAPMWIYEGALLNSRWRTGSAGACELVSALPPNALSQAVIALLCFVLSPEAAGRVYIGACVALFAAGLVYLCRVRDGAGRSLAVPSCLPLCMGQPLFHGFLNYMAALPALCWGLGALLRNPEAKGARGACLLIAMPLVTYVCHGTALGVWCVWIALQFSITRSRTFAWRALLGLLPVLVLIALYVAQRRAEGASMSWSAGGFWSTVFYRARSPFRFFSLFQGWVPTFGDPWLQTIAPLLVIANAGYAAAISCYGLRWAWRSRRDRDRDPITRLLSLSLLALAALFILLPHEVAKMLNPAERLLLPAACVGAAGLASAPANRRARWLCYGMLAAQWLYLATWGTQAAMAARAYIAERERFVDRPGVRVLHDEGVILPPSAAKLSNYTGAIALLTRHQVLGIQGTLQDWAHGRAVTPSETGLFRCKPVPAEPRDLETLRRAEVVILNGEAPRALGIAKLLEPELRVTHAGTGFWTLERARADASTNAGAAR